MRRAAIGLVLAATLTACGGGGGGGPGFTAQRAAKPKVGAAPWPRPDDTLTLSRRAGLVPERKESFVYHVHAHLDVFVNGKSQPVPSGIGIDTADPGVQSGPVKGGTGYGGIELCRRPCISPLHTHDFTGTLHIEAPTKRTFRLGEFFEEWNVRLTRRCAGGYCTPRATWAVFVDGERVGGDPSRIALDDHQEIAIVIGSPPKTIPDAWAEG